MNPPPGQSPAGEPTGPRTDARTDPPRTQRSRGRDLGFKLALAAAATVLAAGVGEITVRLFPGAFGIHAPLEYYMPHVFMSDEAITWTLRPGARSPHQHFAGDYDVHVAIDERGFRATPQAAGRPNLLILGDSFTFGLGVEDNESYPAQLAERLPEWNVLNAGFTGGSALDTQFVWLRRNVKHFNPKRVIFQVFEANDYNEIAENVWEEVDERGLPLRVRTRYYVARGRHILSYRHTSLARKTAALIRRSSYLGFLLVNKAEVFYFLTLPKLLGKTEYFEDSDQIKREADATFAKIQVLIDAIAMHSAEHGYEYGFLLIPRTYWMPGRRVKLYKSEIYEAYLDQQGIAYSTLERLWEEDAAKLHLRNDAHYTAYGNGLVADELRKWLAEKFRPGR